MVDLGDVPVSCVSLPEKYRVPEICCLHCLPCIVYIYNCLLEFLREFNISLIIAGFHLDLYLRPVVFSQFSQQTLANFQQILGGMKKQDPNGIQILSSRSRHVGITLRLRAVGRVSPNSSNIFFSVHLKIWHPRKLIWHLKMEDSFSRWWFQ